MADAVVRIQINQSRFEMSKLCFRVTGVSANYDAIPRTSLVGCGSVYRDSTGVGFCPDGVGCEPLTVINVVYLNLFIFTDPG